MLLKDLYKTNVVTCHRDASIQSVAKMMKDERVGNVVVVEEQNGVRKPVGILTDRDIVLGAVCDKLDSIDALCAADLMSPDVVVVNDDMTLFEAVDCMRDNGVARAPVVDETGELCGVISASRVFKVLSEEMSKLSVLSDERKEFPEQAKRTARKENQTQSNEARGMH